MQGKLVDPQVIADQSYRSNVGLRQGVRLIFTNGCFDVLHFGHISLLQYAKALGGILVVGINSDESIRLTKGPDRPVFTLHYRLRCLAALECVDYLVIQDEITPHRLLEHIQPDYLVKGDEYKLDQVVGHEIVQGYGGLIKTFPMVKGISTTSILERLAK